jgi:hypothetical protein
MKSVTVRVPKGLSLEQSQKVLSNVLGKVGHPACFSGVKISFEDIVDPENLVMSVDKTSLQVSEVGH